MYSITTIALLTSLSTLHCFVSEPSFLIKLYHGEKGDIIDQTNERDDTNVYKTTVNGKAERNVQVRLENSYKEEILEKKKDEKLPTKVKRNYFKAREIMDGKETSLAYDGKEVLIEKKRDVYEFSIDGKPLDKNDALTLDEQWNQKVILRDYDEFLPKKAVKINELWVIDVGFLIKIYEKSGMEADPKNTKASGKLLKTYIKDKQLFGIIELNMEIAAKSISENGMKIELKDGSKLIFHLELETAIDGSKSEVKEKGYGTGELSYDVLGGNITIEMQNKQNNTLKLAK